MLRDSEIREDWAAITIAVKQSQESLRHHDGGQLVRVKLSIENIIYITVVLLIKACTSKPQCCVRIKDYDTKHLMCA